MEAGISAGGQTVWSAIFGTRFSSMTFAKPHGRREPTPSRCSLVGQYEGVGDTIVQSFFAPPRGLIS
jgi:hypothetical protein